jgi:hypothetical protein
MRLVVGSDLRHQISGGSTRPLVFEPEIDWSKFAEPNITHAY